MFIWKWWNRQSNLGFLKCWNNSLKHTHTQRNSWRRRVVCRGGRSSVCSLFRVHWGPTLLTYFLWLPGLASCSLETVRDSRTLGQLRAIAQANILSWETWKIFFCQAQSEGWEELPGAISWAQRCFLTDATSPRLSWTQTERVCDLLFIQFTN